MSKLVKVSVKVKAKQQGYYGGKVHNVGDYFLFEEEIKDGKFPIWMEAPKDFKLEKEEVKKPSGKPASEIV